MSIKLEKLTLKNKEKRLTIAKTNQMQLVVASLKPLEDIPREKHHLITQFVRIEAGAAEVILNDNDKYKLLSGDAIVIPADTYHRIINKSKKNLLKFYSIYTPAEE